jgi:hypothetical protein
MARLIDCSIPDVKACEISLGWTGKLKFRLAYGWNAHEYTQDQIATVSIHQYNLSSARHHPAPVG